MKKPCNGCEKATLHKSYKTGKTKYDRCFECFSCESYVKYEKSLSKKRNYIQGELIHSMEEFAEYIKTNDFAYIRHKIYHIGWLRSLQYQTLDQDIKNGNMKKAIRKDDTE